MPIQDRTRPSAKAGLFAARERRPTLFARDDRSERLLENLPGEVADMNGLRSWTRILLRAVTAWQIERAKVRAAERSVAHV